MLEPASLTVAYESGPWIAIAGSESWLLADVAPDSAVVAGWWSALQAGAGLDDLLAVILDEGLRAVPSFAALGLTDGGLRLLVRGLAQVEIRRGDDAPDSVAGSNATTWTDIRTEGWTQVRLGAPARSAGAPRLPLPLLLGVTLAGALVLEREAAPIQRTPTVETVRGASLRASIPPPPGPPPGTPPTPPPASAPPVSAPPASQQPSIVLPPPAAPPPSPPAPARNFDHLFGATGAAPAAAEPAAEVTAEPAAEPVAAQPAEPVTAAPPPSASHETVHPLPQSETGIIESLPWQLPAAFTSASAAPRPVVTELPTTVTEPPAAAGPQFSYQPDQPSQPGQPSQPNDATLQPHHTTPPPGMLPDTAPPDTALPDTAPPHTAPPAELDSHTVDRASLTAGAAEQGREQGGPTVSAVICAEGHLSEVYAALCRVCGGPIAAQTPFNVRRPVLGLLALSTGDTVMLDRDVVLGRAPVDAREGVERSHVVQVDSVDNDISRTHVLVHLDGWHVLVTDLDSTNGTMVTLPGQAPTRLRPNDPFAIVPGTVVSLADEVTLRYEVPR